MKQIMKLNSNDPRANDSSSSIPQSIYHCIPKAEDQILIEWVRRTSGECAPSSADTGSGVGSIAVQTLQMGSRGKVYCC